MRKDKNMYYANHNVHRRRRKRKKDLLMTGIGTGIVLLLLYFGVQLYALREITIQNSNEKEQHIAVDTAEESGSDSESTDNILEPEDVDSQRKWALLQLESFAREHGFGMEAYPDEWIELLVKNSELEEFVCNYPLKKNTFSEAMLTECLNQEDVPLLMQWDSRWGYYEYGSSVIGVTGCGPTCLSMVAVHLLQNAELTPIYMADYAERNGYYVAGTGTAWTFMSQGARKLGLHVQEVPLDENMVMRYLQQEKPIICAMGRGDFTETGHFIVFTGVEDGKIKINDPNSRERSGKLWKFEDIKYQIKNMWAYF